MRTVFLSLLVCLVLVVAAGFYFNWVSVSAGTPDQGSQRPVVTVNKDKIEHDYNTARETVKDGARRAGEQVTKGVEAVRQEVKKDAKVINEAAHNLMAKTAAGNVTAVDTLNNTLTVETAKKDTVTVKVEAATRVRIDDKDGSLADLKAGMPVSVNYETRGAEDVAMLVTVKDQ
jgi:hypothetical protein